MKSAVLFVVVATLATVHCAETSVGAVEKPKNNDEILQIIKSIICTANQIDIDSIITNDKIMLKYLDKSIQDIQQLYCFNESTTVAMQVTNTDAKTDTSTSSVQPNTTTLPDISTDNTPLVTTKVSCYLPFIDPKKCDFTCFIKIKIDISECINNYIRQYVLLSLKPKND